MKIMLSDMALRVGDDSPYNSRALSALARRQRILSSGHLFSEACPPISYNAPYRCREASHPEISY